MLEQQCKDCQGRRFVDLLFTFGSTHGVSYKDTPCAAILIAAKHLAFAKTRLGRAVGDADRMALAEAMFRDVLAAALSARAADHVAV